MRLVSPCLLAAEERPESSALKRPDSPHTCADLHPEWETQRAGAGLNLSNQRTYLGVITESMCCIYQPISPAHHQKMLKSGEYPSVNKCFLFTPLSRDVQPLFHTSGEPFNDHVKCFTHKK